MGWPYVTRVDSGGVHRTGPWVPWRSTPVRAGVTAGWIVGMWWVTGSVLLAAFATGVGCWAWKATR